ALQQPKPAALSLAIFAPGNAEQPRPKIPSGVKAADMFPGKNESLLRQVIGIGMIARQPPQKGAQRLLVQAHKLREIFRRTGPGPLYPGMFFLAQGGSSRFSLADRRPANRKAAETPPNSTVTKDRPAMVS